MNKNIILRGVRVHNLKNINLDIPMNKLIIITGISGSGKSSLAFDTLYAEGQRRYIESLSAYARQFFEKIEKPDADLIDGISPAIAIQQKTASKNPRSTVATVTELWDYLRILFSRIGTIYCYKCERPVKKDSIDSIIEDIFSLSSGERLFIYFKWDGEGGLNGLRKKGFHKFLKGNEIHSVDELEELIIDAEILVDRMILNREERDRLVDSVEIALNEGKGRCGIRTLMGKELFFSDKYECKECKILYEELHPNLFSFNSPQGACPVCHGFGDIIELDEDKIIPDKSKSLEQGAIEPWTKPSSRYLYRELLSEAKKKGISIKTPFHQLSQTQKDFILNGDEDYYGVKGFFKWLEEKKYKIGVRVFLHKYRKYITCPSCDGSRLRSDALNVKISEKSIADIANYTVEEAYEFFRTLNLNEHQKKIAESPLEEIRKRLIFLLDVGLDYLTLNRMTFTLSGGEAQRISLASALSSSLVGTLFILDEPSVGLHARDNYRLINILNSLKKLGNTIVVVEHDMDIIKSGDYIIDLGPGAGENGGQVIYSGPLYEFKNIENSITLKYLNKEKRLDLIKKRKFIPKDFLEIFCARKYNLKNISIKIPLRYFTCITGVSGSGKSTLMYEVIYRGIKENKKECFDRIEGVDKIKNVVLVDQNPVGKSPRSIPLSYMKAMDYIRKIFSQTKESKINGFSPSHFSFNTPGGRCENCKGAGKIIIEMQFLSDVALICDECGGKRYKKEILEVKYKDKNIYDVLQMSVTEAMDFFSDFNDFVEKIRPLEEVGLGYIKLGQATSTFSGGESQRLKLAYYLGLAEERENIFLFDEPTTGLHLDDISKLIKCFSKLLEKENTIVVIEHNLDIIKLADWIIDLGPEGGKMGGYVIYQGQTENILNVNDSYTGQFLKRRLIPDYQVT
ncbi:MAG: excinuclease ABC subunit UvrA [Acidobacteriota bacterium]